MKQKIAQLLKDDDTITYVSSIFILGAVILCSLVIVFF
jgi:hypothetical protein